MLTMLGHRSVRSDYVCLLDRDHLIVSQCSARNEVYLMKGAPYYFRRDGNCKVLGPAVPLPFNALVIPRNSALVHSPRQFHEGPLSLKYKSRYNAFRIIATAVTLCWYALFSNISRRDISSGGCHPGF